jgi:GT2 family glycosyltransferase
LWIQTVLYEQSTNELSRFLRGIAAAATMAKRSGACKTITLTVGDCSPIRPVEIEEPLLAAELASRGIDRFAYRYFDANLGSAGGHNRLFEECGADVVLIANPDTYASPDMLVELLPLVADPSVGIVEARQLPLEHPKAHDQVTGDTSWASGTCMMLRAETMRSVGGFDAETFFLYCDDVDLSWRVRLAGLRVVHRPSARIFHDKRLSPEFKVQANEAEQYYSAEAALMLAWKYSRPELAATVLGELEDSEVTCFRRAAQTFRLRQSEDTLPLPIDPDGRVAEFVDGGYGPSRFSYDG